MSRLLTPVTEYTSESGSTHTLTPSIPPLDLMEEARSLLETGNMHRFKFLVDENKQDFKFGHVYNDGFSLPIILVQSYKKLEATMGKSQEMPLPDFCQCVKWLARKGANLSHQDNSGRTILHWIILTQTPVELLQASLEMGANPTLQDEEGQSSVHLAIRMGSSENLDVIAKSEPYGSHAVDVASRLSGATPLIYAVQISSYEFVQQLLGYGVQLDTQEDNKYRRTALHYALYVNRTDIFELLLRKGARSDIIDYRDKTVEARAREHPNGTFKKMVQVYSKLPPNADTSKEFHPTTPLMIACQASEFQTAQSLVDGGTDPAAVDDGGKNALHYCAESEETACAELLLAKRPDMVAQRDTDGYTPLHLATIAGNVKLIHLLLQSGAEVDVLDNERHSPVHWAVVCSQADSLKALLDHKAKCMQPDMFGAYPLHYAAQVCGTAQPGDNRPDRILEMLLPRCSRVDCLDYEKRSPLMWAGSVGAKKACEMLVKKGAKPQLGDRAGLTVLHCAASRGHSAIIEMIAKEPGVEINVGDKNDCSPLFYAVTLNQEECVRALVKCGASLDHRDKKGRTAAHCAAAKDLVTMLKVLSDLGADLWLTNSIGDLPIHEAAHMGHLEAVKHLAADSKALLDAKNESEQAVVHIAAFKNQTQMCNAVLRYGADVNLASVSEQGNPVTALDLTSSSECKEFIRRYGGQYAYELDLTERLEERQTLRLTTAIGGDTGGGAAIPPRATKSGAAGQVNTQPYAEAIRKAEEMIARREREEQLRAGGAVVAAAAAAIAAAEVAAEDAADGYLNQDPDEDEILPEEEVVLSSRVPSRRPSFQPPSPKVEQAPPTPPPPPPLLISQPLPPPPSPPVTKEAATITDVNGTPVKKPTISVMTTSTTDLKAAQVAATDAQPDGEPGAAPATVATADGRASSTAMSSESSTSPGEPLSSHRQLQMQQQQQQPRIRLNKPHKVPFFWEKRGKTPVQAMRLQGSHQQQQQPQQQPQQQQQEPRDKQIQRSVREYERLRIASRHSHSSKRHRIYEGAVSDKIMLKMLLEEYRRYCMSTYSLDADDELQSDTDPETVAAMEAAAEEAAQAAAAEAAAEAQAAAAAAEAAAIAASAAAAVASEKRDAKESKSVKLSSQDLESSSASIKHPSTSRSGLGSDENRSSADRSPKSKKFKERERASDFQALLKETRDLYQHVQRQADETLQLARRMNNVLAQPQPQPQSQSQATERIVSQRPKTARGGGSSGAAAKRLSPAITPGSSYPAPRRYGNSNTAAPLPPPPPSTPRQPQPTQQKEQQQQSYPQIQQRPKTSRPLGVNGGVKSGRHRQEQIRKVYSSGVCLPPVGPMDAYNTVSPRQSSNSGMSNWDSSNSNSRSAPGSLHSARCTSSAYNQRRILQDRGT